MVRPKKPRICRPIRMLASSTSMLVNSKIGSLVPLTDVQMYEGEEVGHGGVASLSNEDLIRPGGPQGTDPISGYREFAPGDNINYAGLRLHITGGHQLILPNPVDSAVQKSYNKMLGRSR